ncbi:MAG: exopolysaccharide biosynthesis polyprenyl glycosylphosphotransferase [Chloroflexi bacterium]|nr:exopolysaccharide biosynthesis polyprenyl glycosylphosphotransferase [Chloroflexota bacterium]
MYDIFLHQRYNSTQNIQRMRARLLMRIIRTKLIANLKRFFDIVLTILILPIALPLMLPIVIVIKLDSPGSILYKQKRVGKWGKPFNCYKFRSMYIDADKLKQELMKKNEADEIVFKMKQDPRITPVGRYLRKLSLDELPQLFNVLKGEMSLVGPRPPVPEEVQYYTFDYLRRLNVIPGITGLQQISGRSDLEFKRWIELDLQYIEEQSLRKDIEILIKTIPAVISGRGAY